MGFANEQIVLSMGERVRVLGVTGEQRLSTYPDAPTFSEIGVPQIKGITTVLSARSGTPSFAMEKLHAAASTVLQLSEVKAQFAKIKLEIIGDTPDVAAKRLTAEAQYYGDIGRKIGLRPE